ncbi:hypothetical protein ACTG2V_00105 [Aeromonas sp. 74A]
MHGGLGTILFGQGGDDELYGDDGKDILMAAPAATSWMVVPGTIF